MRRLTDERGMTLVELMTALLVFSLVAGAILSVFMVSLQAYWKGDLATQVQQGGRLSIDRLTRDLRQARRLCTAGATGCVQGGFTFDTNCTTPQISFVLPHVATVTLAVTPTASIYATDPDVNGTIPKDGNDVSYYLAATQGGTTPNTTGPYLERTQWDGSQLTTVTVASNITGLAFAAAGACPATTSREVTVTITAAQTVTSTNVSSTDTNTSDVALRNR